MEQVLSLTRCLAEIKKLEADLANVPVFVRIAANKNDRVEGVLQNAEEFARASQSDWDQYVGKTERLIKLKVARNKANVSTMVKVGGKDVSMDEAIARKALVPVLKNAIAQVKRHISTVEQQVQKSESEVQAAIDKNVNAASSSGTPLTDSQVQILREMYERSLGKRMVLGTNIKTAMKTIEDEVNNFELEIDYVLSEANATTKVSV